jgi:hypothetical protein
MRLKSDRHFSRGFVPGLFERYRMILAVAGQTLDGTAQGAAPSHVSSSGEIPRKHNLLNLNPSFFFNYALSSLL